MKKVTLPPDEGPVRNSGTDLYIYNADEGPDFSTQPREFFDYVENWKVMRNKDTGDMFAYMPAFKRNAVNSDGESMLLVVNYVRPVNDHSDVNRINGYVNTVNKDLVIQISKIFSKVAVVGSDQLPEWAEKDLEKYIAEFNKSSRIQ